MAGSERNTPPPAVPRRRLPAGLLGTLALVLVVESLLPRIEVGLAPLEVANYHRAGEEARTTARDAGILCVGDSLVKTGVVPVVLEKRLGLKATNLGLLGGTTPGSYFLLRRAVEAGARPAALVLDATPFMLMFSNTRVAIRQWAQLLSMREAIEVARVEGDVGLLGPYLLDRFVPSVRMKHDLRRVIVDGLASRPTLPFRWVDVYLRQEQHNGGAFVRSENPPGRPDPCPDGEIRDEARIVCYPNWWWAGRSNLVFLRKVLDLAAAKKMTVFFLLPPIHPAVQSERERLGLEDLYLKLIRDVRRTYPNLVVVDGRHSGYGQDVFCDEIHVDRAGALSISRGLAEVMAGRLAGRGAVDRWDALPRFERSEGPGPVEDEGQSRLALQAEGATFR